MWRRICATRQREQLRNQLVGTEFLEQPTRGFLRLWHVPSLAREHWHTASTRHKSGISGWVAPGSPSLSYSSLIDISEGTERTVPQRLEESQFGTGDGTVASNTVLRISYIILWVHGTYVQRSTNKTLDLALDPLRSRG